MTKAKDVAIPPRKKTTKADASEKPASNGLSDSAETKTLVIKLTPARHAEIKAFASERGISIKGLFLELFDRERGD